MKRFDYIDVRDFDGWLHIFAVIGIILVAIFFLAGCQHKATTSQRASSLAANPAAQRDKAQAEKIIKPCLPANQLSLANKAARTTMVNCIVPNNPVARQQLEQCISDAAVADHLVTKAGRTQFEQGTDPNKPSLVACVVRFAGKGAK